MMKLTVEEAIDQICQGKQIVLVDDEDRENEGDLCMAAEKVTPADINFMARYGRGLICLSLDTERMQRLGLSKMTERNESRFGTNFCVSIEARKGVTTGISAADRATTIQAAVDLHATPRSVVTPGHIFPICARDGGVLVRCGQTEGSVDLARLAGLEPAGVVCEIMNDDGTMARRPDLETFAKTHSLGILTIAQLIEYRLKREHSVEEVAGTTVKPAGLETAFQLRIYQSEVSDVQFMVLTCGDPAGSKPPLVRVHRAMLPSDVFGITNPMDAAEPNKNVRALQKMAAEGNGVFVYVLPGYVNLASQVNQTFSPTDQGPSSGAAAQNLELREFGLGAQVLYALGAKRIRLMTDHPKRIVGLGGFGLEVVETVAIGD